MKIPPLVNIPSFMLSLKPDSGTNSYAAEETIISEITQDFAPSTPKNAGHLPWNYRETPTAGNNGRPLNFSVDPEAGGNIVHLPMTTKARHDTGSYGWCRRGPSAT